MHTHTRAYVDVANTQSYSKSVWMRMGHQQQQVKVMLTTATSRVLVVELV